MDKTGDVLSHICAVMNSLSPSEKNRNVCARPPVGRRNDDRPRTRRRNRYVTGVCFEVRKDA